MIDEFGIDGLILHAVGVKTDDQKELVLNHGVDAICAKANITAPIEIVVCHNSHEKNGMNRSIIHMLTSYNKANDIKRIWRDSHLEECFAGSITKVKLILIMILISGLNAKNIDETTHLKDISCLTNKNKNTCEMNIFKKLDKNLETEKLIFDTEQMAYKSKEICKVIQINRYDGTKRSYNRTHNVFKPERKNIFYSTKEREDSSPQIGDDLIEFLRKEDLFEEEIPIQTDRIEIGTRRLELVDIDNQYSFMNLFESNTIKDSSVIGEEYETVEIKGEMEIINYMKDTAQNLEMQYHLYKIHLQESRNKTVIIKLNKEKNQLTAKFTIYQCPNYNFCPSISEKGSYVLKTDDGRFMPIINHIYKIRGMEHIKCKSRIASKIDTVFPEYEAQTTVMIKRVGRKQYDHTCFTYLSVKKLDESLPYILKHKIIVEPKKETTNVICDINFLHTFISDHIVFNDKSRRKRNVGYIVTTLANLISRGATGIYNSLSSVASATLRASAGAVNAQTAGVATGRLGTLLGRIGIRTPTLSARVAMDSARRNTANFIRNKAISWFTKENVKKLGLKIMANGIVMGGVSGATYGIQELTKEEMDIMKQIKAEDPAMYDSLIKSIEKDNKYKKNMYSIARAETSPLNLINIPKIESNNITNYLYNMSDFNLILLNGENTLSFKELEKLEERAIVILIERENILTIIFNLFNNNLLLPKIQNLTKDKTVQTYTINILNKNSVSQSLLARGSIEEKMGSVRIFKTPVMINGKFVNKKEDRISCMTQSLDKLEDKCKDLVETFMKIFKYGTDRILMTGKNDGEIICSDGIKLISKTDFSGILIPNGCRIVMTNWREDEKPGKGSTMTDIKVLFNTIIKVDEILEVTDFGGIIIALSVVLIMGIMGLCGVIIKKCGKPKYNITFSQRETEENQMNISYPLGTIDE